jgi:hypothetical protein
VQTKRGQKQSSKGRAANKLKILEYKLIRIKTKKNQLTTKNNLKKSEKHT